MNQLQRDMLIYLARFYDVQGYQTWGQEEDEVYRGETTSGSEQPSSQESMLLEDAVQQYPHKAVEAALSSNWTRRKLHSLSRTASRTIREPATARQAIAATVGNIRERRDEAAKTAISTCSAGNIFCPHGGTHA
jgi:hypothetical protein